MKSLFVTSLGLLMAVSAVSSNCWAIDVQFNGSSSTDFNTAANWTPPTLPSANPANVYLVQAGLTSTFSAGTYPIAKLVVGDDSQGTLNMTGGDLSVAGGGDDFEIGRSRIPGAPTTGSRVDLSGTSILRATSNSTVGDRDKGVLHIGPNAQVISPGDYWRIGNYGPATDGKPPATELRGNGLLDVEGKFSARDLFIGVSDGTGVVLVRGTGSVTLSPFPNNDPLEADINMNFNHDPIFQPNQSGTIHMDGSSASMSARNLFSQHSPLSPVKNLLWFTADSGGVSPITLSNAIDISNNALRVDLAGLTVSLNQKILLVDAAPNQITGTFSTLNITGANPANYSVLYDQPTGNISLVKSAPEPSTMVLLGLGTVMAVLFAKRRGSR